MKICNKCNSANNGFFNDKGFKDGLRSTCKVCDKVKNAKWRNANKEHHNEISKQWHKNNKELCVQRALKWNREHREERKFLTYQYKRRLRKATPKWVNKRELAEIYKNRPDGYHVDHIIPLSNENVCGLHVSWNLQYLPAVENCTKGNKV